MMREPVGFVEKIRCWLAWRIIYFGMFLEDEVASRIFQVIKVEEVDTGRYDSLVESVLFAVAHPCPDCGGKGHIDGSMCIGCKGTRVNPEVFREKSDGLSYR